MKIKQIRIALLAALALGTATGAFAAGAAALPADDDPRLRKGVAAHDAVLAGDRSRLAEALELLGPEGWKRPALAAAYHGSALTLKALEAKQAGKLMDALAFIDAGAKEIDAALASEPGSLELRILRLENSMSLIETSPVDRAPQASEDLAALRAAWSSLGPEQQAITDLDEGRLLVSKKRLSDALKRWRAALRDAPDSEAASRARKLIARYGE